MSRPEKGTVKGWTLPSGGDEKTKDSFAYLINIYSITNGSASIAKLTSTPLDFTYSGNYSNDYLNNEDIVVNYWSRIAISDTDAYYLFFNGSYVLPQYNGIRGNGRAIRCLAH